MKQYKTVYLGGEGEYTDKKSRFIASVLPVQSEEEAALEIEKRKKKYWDASHNCTAYVIGENGELQRCSDDKEPAGTAGRPMLEVLLSQGIRNVLVVVTRYFGGTLLGTGGLVRAYAKSVQAGLDNSIIIEKKPGELIWIGTDYNGVGKIQYILGKKNISILDSLYTERVKIKAVVPAEEMPELKKELAEGTNGRVKIESEGAVYYASVSGKIELFGGTNKKI